ncbi:hypothetical protein SAMN04487843_12642 [Methylobacterium sp. ap11]|nr:hypothetical protein SAMN04487843_12642 [Methylobacterium sp. ap11]
MSRAQDRRFVDFHRVLNRAAWSPRVGARILLGHLMAAFAPRGLVVLGLDDTIERRWGKRIRARGIYRDPVRSSHSYFVKTGGLRWLSLMLLAPIPSAQRIWALAFLTALVPSARLPRAEPPAQAPARGRTSDRPPGSPLAARARPRAGGRQRPCGARLPGCPEPPRRGGRHPPAPRCGVLRSDSASPARHHRTSARRGRAAPHPGAGSRRGGNTLASAHAAGLVWEPAASPDGNLATVAPHRADADSPCAQAPSDQDVRQPRDADGHPGGERVALRCPDEDPAAGGPRHLPADQVGPARGYARRRLRRPVHPLGPGVRASRPRPSCSTSTVVVRPLLELKAEQSVAGLGLVRSTRVAASRSGRTRSPRRRPSSSASAGAGCRC